MRNKDVAEMLEGIADLLELKGDSIYRIAAYREAARRIDSMTEDIANIDAEGRLEEIPGVGPSISAKIDEYLRTGHLGYLDSLGKQVAPGLAELLRVPGLGARRAELVNKELGIKSVAELVEAAREHRLDKLPGIREKMEEKILREALRVTQRTKRLLLGVALPAAEEVVGLLRDHPAVKRIDPAGSIRRMKETIGDIDILVASDRPKDVMEAFTTLPIAREVLAKGTTRASILTEANLQIDIRVIKPEEYGSALQYFSGSKSHNIALRELAIRRGLKLSEYGLFDDRSDKRLGGRTEEEIYEILGLDWMPPELRENRGEIEAALEHRLPKLVEEKDILGDLHLHTKWSDGSDTVEAMVEAAIKRGYKYAAITDHSRSLGVAGGLSDEEVREQRRLIEGLQDKYAPFRILHGSEVNIRTDGNLDYDEETLRLFDIVTVSIHGGFGQTREKIDGRISSALRHPLTRVLNHPTGRLIGKRTGYAVDLEEVLKLAARMDTAVEINAQPDRLDLDDIWARRAKQLGVMGAIDSDAHSTGHLGFMRYGVAVARRGWLEKKDVLNALPLNRLLSRLHSSKKAA
ncbi:MAG: DNA polymerase/3'-5' exonuclease PolX [Chloroflexi bacterium]|nr:DNA polymerase/3'-5' exonuclease PolX [Chloroflexota bacterium]